MAHGEYDFRTVKGDSLPLRIRIHPLDGTGALFTFACAATRPDGTDRIEKTSGDNSLSVLTDTDPADPTRPRTLLSLTLSPAETGLFGEGRVNAYAIKHHTGTDQTTLLAGFVVASEGVPADGQ